MNLRQSTSMNEGNLPAQLDAQLQFNQSIASLPIVGTAAAIYSAGLERLPMFGGNNPGDTGTAIFNAQQSVLDVTAGNKRIQESRTRTLSAEQMRNEGISRYTFGPISRQREALLSEYTETMDSLKNQQDNLQSDAASNSDPNERHRAELALNQLKKDLPALKQSAYFRLQGGLKSLERDVSLTKTAMQRRIPAISALRQGFSGLADEREYESGLQDEEDQADPLLKPVVTLFNDLKRKGRRGLDLENLRRREAGMKSDSLILSRHPLQAEISDIDESEREALKEAPLRDGDDLYNARLKSDITAGYDTKRSLARQRYDDQISLINLRLHGQSVAADESAKGFNVSAQATGIAYEGLGSAEELQQAGLPDQSNQTLDIAFQRLTAFRRGVAQSFQPETTDRIGTVNLTTPDSGYESPDDIFGHIDDLQNQIQAAKIFGQFNDVMNNSIIPALTGNQSGTGGSAVGGTDGSGLDNIKNVLTDIYNLMAGS